MPTSAPLRVDGAIVALLQQPLLLVIALGARVQRHDLRLPLPRDRIGLALCGLGHRLLVLVDALRDRVDHLVVDFGVADDGLTRELERQKAWRDQATRAMQSYKAVEGTGPVNAEALDDDDEVESLPLGIEEGEHGETLLVPGGSPLPTLSVLPQGISRKRLEQAVRDLGLPVVIARDVDEADVVMTLKNEYKQKTPLLREAEERAMPIYVLKSNTIPQMQSSLTSIFSLEIDPREAAMRETEEAIGLVLNNSEPVELSPQNAYIRRLQHQMAERANIVSRSRGREPFRRVRLYPDPARSTWR